MDEPTKDEIEDFLKANDVDERAAADLRDCPPDVQRRALARGDLSSARNPSAALLARIRDARVEVRGGGSGGIYMGGTGVGLPSTKAIEDFIQDNRIGDSAAKTLRESSPTVKRAVLACGNLSGNQDPSTELLARIRDAPRTFRTQDIRAGGLGLPSNQDVEDFIKDNDVDGRAAADLRDLPPALQRAVLVRGDLRSARNPSSALIARIRDAKLGVPGPGAPALGGPPAGDMAMVPAGDGSMPPGGYPFPPYGAPVPGMPPGYPPPGYAMFPGGGYPGGWYPGYPGYPGPGGYGGYPGYPGGPGGYPGYPPGQGGYGSGGGGGDQRSGGGRSPGGRRGRSKGRSRSGSSSYSGSYSRSRSRSRGRGGGGGGAKSRRGRSRRR
uniref:Uncharacterized protein n=1 Tax=Alexandrium monilatum TaxID=311494 RepID=A0A7S4RLN9_9DINO|mmetsp:Transcript_6151/g.18414  ORF Transcript_6151/g.18414 Transcript_6151/m.18414 type:complete len:382 (-) Transcript_6151:116-1261(-)